MPHPKRPGTVCRPVHMSPDDSRQSPKVVDQKYNTRLFIIITVIPIQPNAKDLRSSKNKRVLSGAPEHKK